jgi:class 3 adenylate cyclase
MKFPSDAVLQLPTGTVTFLFTDIQGSTPFWERAPEQMAQALQIHNAALRKAIEAHGGAVFKTVGDAFQAAFATAPQALRAAIEGQRALQSAPWNELGELKVRMGLHTGEAGLDPGGDEYAVSHTKNRIGRIHSVAHGGQILLSQETADLVRRTLPEEVGLKDLGEHHQA